MNLTTNEIISSHHPKKHAQSFGYAISGLAHVLRYEKNFRVHLFFIFLVILLGSYFNLEKLEWILLTITIGLVLSSELLNSVIEELIDHLVKEHHEGVRIIKDVSAGAVLVSAMISLIVGLFIFLPKILTLF